MLFGWFRREYTVEVTREQVSFGTPIEKPFIGVIPGKASLVSEIDEWCRENLRHRPYITVRSIMPYSLPMGGGQAQSGFMYFHPYTAHFHNHKDAVAFKLRWG